MLNIICLSTISNIVEAASECVLAGLAIWSAISYFHHSYRIEASFDIDKKSFSKLKVTFVNKSKTNTLIEFEGIIPSKHDIIYDKLFWRKRIKIILPHMIHYDKTDSNYNPSYVRYFRRLTTMDPHSALKRIEFPLTDIIKICHLDPNWYTTLMNELIYNRKISFVVLFKDYKRKAILKLITINPKIDEFQLHAYNFIISNLFSRKTLKYILSKQDLEIKKYYKLKQDIFNIRILS